MRKLTWLLLAAFVLSCVATAVAAPEVKKATGKVTFICPKHCGIKVKVDDKEIVLFVYDKCPKKDERKKEIAALKVGDTITASYFKCPESNKLYLTKIEKPKT